MNKTLIALFAVIALSGCMKQKGPDETAIIEGNDLRLPPNYELVEPNNVYTISTTPKTAESKSQEILLKGTIKQDDSVNKELLINAGGQKRVKNIKEILDYELKQEESKED
jgi:hypothetical protein